MLRKFCAAVVGGVSLAAGFPSIAQLPPPEAYIDPVDRQIAESGEGIFGRPYPCALEKLEQGDTVVMFIPTDQCVKMLPAEEWHGLWRNDFEGSHFCAAPASTCDFDAMEDRVWLEPGPMQGEVGALYEVRFVGRKTMFKGGYGHMGVSDYEIIVDRPIFINMVQAPPQPMSEAEAEAWRERCEKAGNCMSHETLKKMYPEIDFDGTTTNR